MGWSANEDPVCSRVDPRRLAQYVRFAVVDKGGRMEAGGSRVAGGRAGVSSLAGSAPGAATSLERIGWIVGLESDPVRRNLLITQCYHDLSSGLAGVLGGENANWCTFATWASKTAGGFIREDEVPAAFRVVLGNFAPVHITLARASEALARVDGHGIEEDSLLGLVRDVVHDVSRLIAAGNLLVFGELGPVFSRVIDALEAGPGKDALAGVEATLKRGMSERGGQNLLRSALEHYAAARVDSDVRRKAQLMLLANAQVGLHEQIRLQPYIAGSIDAPISDALFQLLEESGERLPHGLRKEMHALASRLLHPVADAVERLWQEFSTRELMKLTLPDGTLQLGKDLPAPPGQPLYPSVLDPIDDRDAQELFVQYGADTPGTGHTAATDWARLSDRMRYILDLFRSRQCDTSLGHPPFTDRQQAALLAGKPVKGKL
jgi:hypothetical protein